MSTTRTRAVRPLDWAFPPRAVQREVLRRTPAHTSGRPPLLFVHGLGHGAWCWEEHWLPTAAEAGYPAAAVSLRGHGGSGGGERLRRTLLRDYVHDVVQAAVSLPEQPVLVGHSMGALAVAYAMARYPARGAVLLAPAAPDHNLESLVHIGRRRPAAALAALAGRTLPLRGDDLFRGLDPQQARAWCARTGPESPVVQYQLVLPHRVPPPLGRPPVLVAGTPDDALVPPGSVRRTARRYGVEPVWFPGFGHDMMLEPGWREPLQIILDWVARTVTD